MWAGGWVFVACATLNDMTHLSRTNPDLRAGAWAGFYLFAAGLLAWLTAIKRHQHQTARRPVDMAKTPPGTP